MTSFSIVVRLSMSIWRLSRFIMFGVACEPTTYFSLDKICKTLLYISEVLLMFPYVLDSIPEQSALFGEERWIKLFDYTILGSILQRFTSVIPKETRRRIWWHESFFKENIRSVQRSPKAWQVHQDDFPTHLLFLVFCSHIIVNIWKSCDVFFQGHNTYVQNVGSAFG